MPVTEVSFPIGVNIISFSKYLLKLKRLAGCKFVITL